MIRFQRVSLRFPRAAHPTLQDCSFAVAAGELVVILGPSGCGKTTLLKLVNRLYEATTGQIFLEAREIRQLNLIQLRRQIGYVMQQAGLFPHMTVAENIAVVPRLLNWGRGKIQARVDELLELIQLPAAEYRDRYPAQLSGGQQQRVGLARALAANPQVLLMDEPFGALDAITRTALQEEILRLQRQLQKTILFVSHDVEEALRLADRILILHRGQILQYDTPLQLLTRPVNAFVYELVGAGDPVRQLGLFRAETVMSPLEAGTWPPGLPTLARSGNLRQALARMLQTGTSQLLVMEGEKAVGSLTLAQIQAVLQAASPPAPRDRPQFLELE